MTHRPTRRRRAPRRSVRAWLGVFGAVVALGLAPALAASVGDTSAAWSNPAYLVSAAGSGSWVAGLGSCQVVSSTSPYTPVTPAPACTVKSLTYTSYNDGKPAGQRHANVYFTITATVTNGQLVKLNLNLAAAAGIPADWNMATSGIDPGNVTAYPGYKCTDMASGVFTALAPAWTASGSSAYLGELVENRAETGHSYACV